MQGEGSSSPITLCLGSRPWLSNRLLSDACLSRMGLNFIFHDVKKCALVPTSQLKSPDFISCCRI